MKNALWDLTVNALIVIFMPLVCFYHAVCANHFLNVAIENASGFEKAANVLLVPVHYTFAGRVAQKQEDGTWAFKQRFSYDDKFFWVKTIGSSFSLLPSAVFGSLAKIISLLDSETKEKFLSLDQTSFKSHIDRYKELGLEISEIAEKQMSLGFQRRPGDEKNLAVEKQALKDIVNLLNEAKIPWWADCGTCIGAYRYGGAIPWDHDIDIAVLIDDFDNIVHTLKQLDPNKYILQDWSSRSCPKSYLKIYVVESGNMIDIYHFKILPESKQLQYVFTLDSHMMFPEWFKVRERKFTRPVAFDTVFPLKKMDFDGIEVFVPNDTQKYLQRCYGENLNPVKVYIPVTNSYEKDLSHPYWQLPYAH
jgi:hypothetical protein